MTEFAPFPFPVRAALARLLDACPECRGYAKLGGLFGADPNAECPACGALRRWVWDNYRIEFPVKT